MCGARRKILVNNAGVTVAGPIDSELVDESALDRQLAINYTSVVAAIRAAFPLLPDGGRIVSISSGVGTRVGFPGMTDYAGAKSALEGYSRGAARDLAHRGITVNVIQPGFIDTEMNPADGSAAPMFLPTTATGRYGRPEEIAAGVVFLAGPQASYVTGAVLRIDGDTAHSAATRPTASGHGRRRRTSEVSPTGRTPPDLASQTPAARVHNLTGNYT
ncbi:SDR family oxidoreductase [Nocardia sp. NPDC050799]|uniref:SDR family NAD(P)-dependent oxidoreductase n=1 Tax=Nocardia sp. NPDC050799 TaxID=3154842 RepID=UPI0033D1AB50